MKKSIFILLLAMSFAIAFSACSNSTPKNTVSEPTAATKVVYTCTMHPEVRSDKPGDCPKCGMKLVVMETADTAHMHNQSDTTHMHN